MGWLASKIVMLIFLSLNKLTRNMTKMFISTNDWHRILDITSLAKRIVQNVIDTFFWVLSQESFQMPFSSPHSKGKNTWKSPYLDTGFLGGCQNIAGF
jgi:hypothetical protein